MNTKKPKLILFEKVPSYFIKIRGVMTSKIGCLYDPRKEVPQN